MPDLTRRRDPDRPEETWQIHFGDVHVGTISRAVGNPGALEEWQWFCGFYPGSKPGECRRGSAPTFDEARAVCYCLRLALCWVIWRQADVPLPAIAKFHFDEGRDEMHHGSL